MKKNGSFKPPPNFGDFIVVIADFPFIVELRLVVISLH